jgi:DNA-binding IclR family transcriptional regulator
VAAAVATRGTLAAAISASGATSRVDQSRAIRRDVRNTASEIARAWSLAG